MHTDAKSVAASPAPRKLQIGRDVAKGLGAGGDAARGRASASESLTEIRAECQGAEVVLVCTGLGGGTGSGAAPVVAEQAKKAGALVIGVVTLPFAAEGSKKRELADEAVARLGRHCLAVICFENDRMVEVAGGGAPVSQAFDAAAGTLALAVRAIVQMLALPAVMPVGLDELMQMFEGADARAHFGYGVADGPDRARAAVEQALSSPLLEEAKLLSEPGRVLVHLTGDDSLSLAELQSVLRAISPRLGPATQLNVGVAHDSGAAESLGVTVFACTRSGMPVAAPEDDEDFPAEGAAPAAGGIADEERPKSAGKKGKGGKKSDSGQTQEELPLDQSMRGRFKDLVPTMVDGQDLDIPTFIRMRIRLN
jgi:cell division protein FtsZ